MWIAWSGDRSGLGKTQIIVKSSADGVNWSGEQNVTGITQYGDKAPSIDQDRNGTIWISFTRNVPCSCGQGQVFYGALYYAYSINSGATWTGAIALPSTTGNDQLQSNVSQLTDKNVYIFYTLVNCGGGSCTVNLLYFKNLVQSHDAKMNSFANNATISPTYGQTLRSGQYLRLTLNVSNTGDFSETFTVTVRANSTIVATNSSIFNIGQSKLVTFNWLTSGKGRYLLTANITTTPATLESQANYFDNSKTTTVLVRPAGDVNTDCTVNIIDMVIVAGSFGKSAGNPGFNPVADVNGDGKVDIIDMSIIGSTFGQSC